MIRALREVWRAFWGAFAAGFRWRYLLHSSDAEAIASDWRAVGGDLYRAMKDAEPEILAAIPEDQRAEAQAKLHAAMARYGFRERDRRRQAGREA